MFKRLVLLCGSLLLAALVTGCAHPIAVTADLTQISGQGKPPITGTAGYHISAEDRARQVTTPGGGGDKVSYFPYRDLEAGFYKALSEVFANVVKLDAAPTAANPAGQGARWVILPVVTTNSSSGSALTWPPTEFTIDLVCKVVDASGAPITEVKVSSVGRAEFSEFRGDHALSAKRAAQQAMNDLVKALQAEPALRR